HLAWQDGFQHYSDRHVDNLPKHYDFIKKFIEAGVRKVAVMGSMHEIGFFEGSINENTSCHPITPYGISKNALRELVEVYAKKNNVMFQWLRGYYIVGNSKSGCSIFSKIAIAESEGKTDFPFTMGLNQYDFIDYDKFCERTVMAVLQNNILGVINICSGYPEKLADRVERFIKENHYNIRLKYGAFPLLPQSVKGLFYPWGDGFCLEIQKRTINIEKSRSTNQKRFKNDFT
ncbi:MAG: NAD(P)-dependent oxidoreductase, partial [Prevotella sp.]|nr:NAD(P)-dependent oxidoreductase [Prevotella sp.]